jgi:hypothetical protein
MNTTILISNMFIRDCIECDCDIGEWDGRRLTASPEQLHELRSRAEHYAGEHVDACDYGLIRSARAVIKKLDALGL